MAWLSRAYEVSSKQWLPRTAQSVSLTSPAMQSQPVCLSLVRQRGCSEQCCRCDEQSGTRAGVHLWQAIWEPMAQLEMRTLLYVKFNCWNSKERDMQYLLLKNRRKREDLKCNKAAGWGEIFPPAVSFPYSLQFPWKGSLTYYVKIWNAITE